MSLKWFFLACVIFAPSQVAGQSLTYRLKGQEVIWKPTLTYEPDDILWKHNGNKVVEFNGQEQQEFGQHQNRIVLDWVSAEFTIRDLRYEDNGLYELEVSKANRDFLRFPYRLEVIDKVAKPTISCQMDDGSTSKDSGMLVCSAEPRKPESLMKYEWSSHGTVHPGQNLTIPLGETHDDQVYNCTVNNPLSRETATFTAKDCYPNQSSTVAIAVVVAIIIALFVLGGLVVLFLKRKRTACFADRVKRSSPQGKEGSDKGEEHRSLLGSGSTPPQAQNDETEIISENDRKEQDVTPQKGQVSAIAKQLEKNNPEKSMNKEFSAAQNDETEIISENDRKEQDVTPQKGRVSMIAKQLEENKMLLEKNNPEKSMNKEFSADKNKDKHKNIMHPPPSQRSESPSSQEQNNLTRSDKGDADADQPEESAEEKEEEDPAGVSEMEPSAAPEQPAQNDETEIISENDRKEQDVTPQKGRVSMIAKQLEENKMLLEKNNPEKSMNKEFSADKNKDKHKNIMHPPPSQRSESPSSQEQNNLTRSDKGDADADQPEESAEEKEEEDPAGVSEMEPSAAPEQPESEKESDEDKEPVSPPALRSRPAVPPRPPLLPRPPRTLLTHNSPNTLPEDTAEDRTKEASLDQVSGETVGDDSMEAETSSTSPEQKDSETSLHEQDKDKDKMDKSASAVENESDSEGDGELKDKDLYLAASEQPQSPSPAKPDNSTIQESADTAQAEPDQEEKGKTRHESGEGEGKIVEDKN